jgi:hypothetical protein
MSLKKVFYNSLKNIKFKVKKFLGVGWKSKISLKRATFSISINKLVAEGCCLEKGQELYSYLAEDEKDRKMIVTYLDGKKMNI